MRALTLLLSIVLVLQPVSAQAFWWKKDESTANKASEYDQKRISDLVQIAGHIEAYYDKVGYYPLLREVSPEMLYTFIGREPPSVTSFHVPFPIFKLQLENGLGYEVTLPVDPQDGQRFRSYQYLTNGQDYHLAAFLQGSHPLAVRQEDAFYKFEIVSRPNSNDNQYTLRDVKRYLKFGPDDPELQEYLRTALLHHNFDAARQAIEQGANPSPACDIKDNCQFLAQAAERGDLKQIRFLIENGASIDGFSANYDVALNYAVANNKWKAARLLVHLGADVNIPNALGLTPFIGVCVKGNVNMTKFMISHGADLNRNYLIRDAKVENGLKSVRPLEAAVKYRKINVVEVLLDAGASVHRPSAKDGKTVFEMGRDLKLEEFPRLKKMIFDKEFSKK